MSNHPADHSHVSARRVFVAAGITLAAGALELVGAWKGRSLFLAADALHLLAHLGIFGILLIPPGRWHRRGEDIATLLILGIVLLIAVGIGFASLKGLALETAKPAEPAFMLLAIVGLVANIATAYLLTKADHLRWSFRAAIAHELSDGALTVVGLLGIPAIQFLGWSFVDPGLSLMIGAWLMGWSSRLLIRRVRGGPQVWTQEGRVDP